MRSKKDMMCSCGERKGACNCKGYADGTKMVTPMGYYQGSLYATADSQKPEDFTQNLQGARFQAAPISNEPTAEEQVGQVVATKAIDKGVDYGFEKAGTMFAKEAATQPLVNAASAAQLAGADAATKAGVEGLTKSLAGEGVKIAGQEATKAAASSAGSSLGSALVPGIGALGVGLLDDGQISKAEGMGAAGSTIGAALGAPGGPLGMAVGSFIGGLAGNALGGGGGSKAAPVAAALGPLMGGKKAPTTVPETESEKMMKDEMEGYQDGTTNVTNYTQPLDKPRVAGSSAPQQQQGLDIEAMAAEGFLGFAPKLAADKAFREDTIDFVEDNPLASLLLGPLVSGFKDGTKKVQTTEEPDYRRLSSGGWADLNFSKRTLEQNKKAMEDHYKRIQEAMQAAQ
jgi:hypothetical protein